MNTTRRGSSTVTLLSCLVLFLLLVIMAAGAFFQYADNQGLKGLDPENFDGKTIEQVNSNATQLENDIRKAESDLRWALNVKHDFATKIGAHGMRYDEPTRQVVELKVTPWQRAQQQVTSNLERIQIAENALKDQPNLFDPLEDNQRDFNEQIRDTNTQISQADVQLQEDRDRLDGILEDLEDRRKEAISQFHTTKSELATERSRLEGRIRELLELRLNWIGELRPDSTVVEVGLDHNFLVIGIGSQDRVFNGLKLEVFQYQQGRYQKKGFCEVVEVRDTYATCRIVEEVDPKRDPIIKGDMVANPLFSTDRAPIVVLAGEFQLYNKSDLKMFLERTGAVVKDQLGPEVDYLIAAEHSVPAQDQAREYRIMAMKEATAVTYLDTSFSAMTDPQ